MREFRDRHLGDFAYLLHLGPREVDALRLRDFAQLVLWIEAYVKAQKKANEG